MVAIKAAGVGGRTLSARRASWSADIAPRELSSVAAPLSLSVVVGFSAVKGAARRACELSSWSGDAVSVIGPVRRLEAPIARALLALDESSKRRDLILTLVLVELSNWRDLILLPRNDFLQALLQAAHARYVLS
jgi:hypothetical protein